MVFETKLSAKYDPRKSFYGKAKVYDVGSEKVLYSYGTKVADIDYDSNTARVYGIYSSTTLRHIKEFLKQNGFKAENKSQIVNDYIYEDTEEELSK